MNVFAAVADVFIAAILCWLLHTSRTKFSKSNTLINKLVRYHLEVFRVQIANVVILDDICGQHWFADEVRASVRSFRNLIQRHNSVCACISLITYFAVPNSFIYIAFYFLMGRRTWIPKSV